MQYRMILAAFAAGATTVLAAPALAGPVELAARQYTNQTIPTAGSVTSTNVTNTGVTNTGVTNTGVTNTGVTNTGVTNTGVTNTGVINTGVTNTNVTITDTDVFNLALTLEQLESAFYQQGLLNFTSQDFENAGLPAAFYTNLRTVASHELTHVSFLESALGSAAVEPCEYQFPSTDPTSFLQFSAAVESAGVSAYLGAAPYISSKTYLTEAGSILAVEARHSAYLRYARTLLDNPPVSPYSPFPSPFDIPLSPSEAFTVASRYIVSCPSGNAEKLAFLTEFPLLDLVDQTATLTNGSVIELAPQLPDGVSLNDLDVEEIYAAFPTVTGPIYAPVSQSDSGYTTVVPAGLNGQAYVVLVDSMDAVTDETILFGPAVLQITNDPVGSVSS